MTAARAPARRRRSTAALTALAGIVTLLSSLTPTLADRERVLRAIEPAPAQAAAHAVGIAGGLGLLALAWGVLGGRRRAGHAAVALLCVVAGIHAAKGLDFEEALIALGVAAVLRAAMRAGAREAAPSAAVVAGGAAVAAAAGVYAVCLGSLLLHGGPDADGRVVGRAAAAAWGFAEGDATAVGALAATLLHVLLAVAALALVLWLRALLAPRRAEDGHGEDEHARAAAIVAEHAVDSIAPFVLRADKAFFFARGGLLAYRTLGATAVVSGDPVGPPRSAPAILADFLAFAERRRWDVVVTAAGPEHLDGYRALGLRTLQIGLEAVADPAALSLAGGAHKTLRKAVNRVERRGWTVEIADAARLGPTVLAELADVERAWRAGRPRLQGFAMASDRLWGAPEDARDVYVLGRAPDGRLHGFLRFVPFRDGLSLDAMRRRGDEPNGFNEALVVAGLRHAAALGCREVSLNFAGFAHVMAAGAIVGVGGRLLRLALRAAHGRFQLERLARFNARFDPAWRPRHLVYPSTTRLPVAALRVLQAEAYVRAPRARPRRGAWRPAAAPIGGVGAAAHRAR